MTAVAIETTHAVELMERIETLESVAHSLPEDDERRSQLLQLVEKDLATATPLRPRVVAQLLGLSEKTVRAWVEEGVLLRAETSSPRLLLDVERVHDVLHLIKDLREAGNTSIHLGSAVVHRRPSGSVCIVPVGSQHRGRLFLPFSDDDPKTAEVVSKVVLLARDHEIKDPSILEQLRG